MSCCGQKRQALKQDPASPASTPAPGATRHNPSAPARSAGRANHDRAVSRFLTRNSPRRSSPAGQTSRRPAGAS
jgi:hypothetical protein